MLLLSSYLLSLSHRFMQFVLWLPCLGFACFLALSLSLSLKLKLSHSLPLSLFYSFSLLLLGTIQCQPSRNNNNSKNHNVRVAWVAIVVAAANVAAVAAAAAVVASVWMIHKTCENWKIKWNATAAAAAAAVRVRRQSQDRKRNETKQKRSRRRRQQRRQLTHNGNALCRQRLRRRRRRLRAINKHLTWKKSTIANRWRLPLRLPSSCLYSPWYANQVAKQATQILRLQAIPPWCGRKTKQGAATPITSARKKYNALLQQR